MGSNISFRCPLLKIKIMKMEKSEKTVLRQYIYKASASYMERSAKKCSCDDNLFPLGKIVVDFKKVEKACIYYKK